MKRSFGFGKLFKGKFSFKKSLYNKTVLKPKILIKFQKNVFL